MDTLSGWAMSKDQSNTPQHETQQEQAQQEQAWLLGQPPLDTYLEHAAKTAASRSGSARSELVDEWRKANDYYYELEITEAGQADQIELLELPSSLHPLASEVMADSSYRRAFDTLPTRIAMVQLERLIVTQRHVNLPHAKRLRAQLSSTPPPEELFRFCLPLRRPDLSVKIKRTGADRFTLWSESSDFRFQEAVMLQPDQIVGHDPKGAVGGVIGLMVGFGSNFLCAVQSENRLVLRNGYHRAYSLLEHGVTHAPCIVETVSRRDELELVAGGRLRDAPVFYFKAPRPPLLRDFLDPNIRKVIRAPRVLHMIDVHFDVHDYRMAL